MITKWQKFSFAFLLALAYSDIAKVYFSIGHFTVVYLVAKPLIWSEAEGDLVVLGTRI